MTQSQESSFLWHSVAQPQDQSLPTFERKKYKTPVPMQACPFLLQEGATRTGNG